MLREIETKQENSQSGFRKHECIHMSEVSIGQWKPKADCETFGYMIEHCFHKITSPNAFSKFNQLYSV